MAGREDELIRAVDCALAGDWETAHAIAQRHEGNAAADWLHAVLHKIEGDGTNSRYWYGRAGQAYGAYADAQAELRAIKAALTY